MASEGHDRESWREHGGFGHQLTEMFGEEFGVRDWDGMARKSVAVGG
jgi:hypothetical protein